MKATAMVILVLAASLPAFAEDMQKYLEETRALVKEGKHQEALDRFLWFHEHALEHSPGMYGVRLSSALADWKGLGDVYPPALTAIRKTRDDKAAVLEAGKGSRALFHDVLAINRQLGDNSRTLDLFRELERKQPDLARECWPVVQETAWQARAYDVARKHVGNPLQEFAELKKTYDKGMARQTARAADEGERAFVKAGMDGWFQKAASILVFMALAGDDAKTAHEIQAQALEVVDTPLLRRAIPKDRELPETTPDVRRPKPSSEALAALVEDACRGRPEARESAMRKLTELPPEMVLPAVLEPIRAASAERSEAAAHRSLALQAVLARLAPRAVPALTGALEDRDPAVRTATLCVLGGLRSTAGESANAVGALLKDEDREIRMLAASVLWHLGPQAVPTLTKALGDEDPDLRTMVAHCCVASYMGGVSDPNEYAGMVPVLRNALQDRDPNSRLAAAAALVWLAPAEADAGVTVLKEGLKSTNADTRQFACGGIQSTVRRMEGGAQFQVHVPGLVAALTEALKDGIASADVAASLGDLAPQPNTVAVKVWTNSLGMEFVPVPGTDVLLCRWETRRQDFDAFVKETAYDATADVFSLKAGIFRQQGATWRDPGFTQGPTHPVVGVSWNDAQAFCLWLTERERREGRLQPGQRYRLPQDWEWSVAVELHEPRTGRPQFKSGAHTSVYPWGAQWPPPLGAGNYAGSEAQGSDLKSDLLPEYRDAYPHTAPVGSFAANRFGLYDMGGNAWEWCDDFFDGSSGPRVLRGGSWVNGTANGLRSSFRGHELPKRRRCTNGFRCALMDANVGQKR